ncbi:MAG: MFS transporter [Firmicutes bacterium]|nr:MFS transporter [Bacillota bacterium]
MAEGVGATVPNDETPLWNRDFALVFLGRLFYFGNMHLVLTLLPVFLASLGTGSAGIGVAMGIPGLVAFFMRPFIGGWVDAGWGRKMMVAGALLSIAIPLGYYLTGHLNWPVYLLRVVQGLGLGLFLTASLVSASSTAPRARLGEALGLTLVVNIITIGLVPPAALFISFHFGFGPAFALAAVFALGALACALIYRPPAKFSGGDGQGPGWGSLLGERGILRIILISIISWLIHGAVTSFVILAAKERGIAHPGLFFTAYAVAAAGSRLGGGRLADRVERNRLVLISLALSAASLGLLTPASTLAVFLVAGFLYGLGTAAQGPVFLSMLIDKVGQAHRGRVVSLYGAAADLGLATGPAVFGFLLPAVGYGGLFAVGAALFAGLGLAAVLGGWREKKAQAAYPPADALSFSATDEVDA